MEREGKRRGVEKERYCLPVGHGQRRRGTGEAARSVSILQFRREGRLRKSQFY